MPHLKKLRIGRNQLGAAGGEVLAESAAAYANLEALSLHSNNLGAAGVTAVASLLRSTPRLHELVLGHNEAGDEGALALADALKGRPTPLIRFDIRDNGIGALAGEALRDAMPSVQLEATPPGTPSKAHVGADAVMAVTAAKAAASRSKTASKLTPAPP